MRRIGGRLYVVAVLVAAAACGGANQPIPTTVNPYTPQSGQGIPYGPYAPYAPTAPSSQANYPYNTGVAGEWAMIPGSSTVFYNNGNTSVTYYTGQ
jgi:hypothetical protein